MVDTDKPLKFSLTPFYVTRQFYYGLETGEAVPSGFDIDLEYNHSPHKDHVLICGSVDASTISLGKFLLAKSISHTYTLPTDPVMVATALAYKEGNGMFVRTKGDIDSPTDLAGKRVGIHDKSMVFVYHNAILEDLFDVPVDEIEWVFDTHQGLTKRMEEGDIDAVERVGDWYWNLRTSDDHEMLYDMAKQWNELEGYDPIVHVIGANDEFYDARQDDVETLVGALQASAQYRNEHYEDILAEFATENDDRTEWTGEKTIEELRRITGSSQASFTLTDTDRQKVRDWMEYAERYGVMAEPVPDERLYPE